MARNLATSAVETLAPRSRPAGVPPRRSTLEEQLAGLGELGDALGRAVGVAAVVGVGEAQQPPEPALHVARGRPALPAPRPKHLHRPPPLGRDADPRAGVDRAVRRPRPGRRPARGGRRIGMPGERGGAPRTAPGSSPGWATAASIARTALRRTLEPIVRPRGSRRAPGAPPRRGRRARRPARRPPRASRWRERSSPWTSVWSR